MDPSICPLMLEFNLKLYRTYSQESYILVENVEENSTLQ